MTDPTLADPQTRREREGMLADLKMAPLVAMVLRLRDQFGEVPWPDPADGGVGARILLLLESPGPKIRSTGFVSLDNPTGTSRNLKRFLSDAGLDRRELLIWNLVPWVIHAPGALNRAPTAGERARGLALVPELLSLLPRLRSVVLAGRHAALASGAVLSFRDLRVWTIPHPSPTYVCTSPAVTPSIVAGLVAANDVRGRP